MISIWILSFGTQFAYIRQKTVAAKPPSFVQKTSYKAHRKTSMGWGFGGRDIITCNVSH